MQHLPAEILVFVCQHPAHGANSAANYAYGTALLCTFLKLWRECMPAAIWSRHLYYIFSFSSDLLMSLIATDALAFSGFGHPRRSKLQTFAWISMPLRLCLWVRDTAWKAEPKQPGMLTSSFALSAFVHRSVRRQQLTQSRYSSVRNTTAPPAWAAQ